MRMQYCIETIRRFDIAMNRIQFQPGLSLAAFLRDYGKKSQRDLRSSVTSG